MKSLPTALAVAAMLAAAPTFAATTFTATSPARETVSIRVSAQGADLNDPVEQARFNRKLTRAIAAACNPGDRLHADLSPDWQCRREMAASAAAAR